MNLLFRLQRPNYSSRAHRKGGPCSRSGNCANGLAAPRWQAFYHHARQCAVPISGPYGTDCLYLYRPNPEQWERRESNPRPADALSAVVLPCSRCACRSPVLAAKSFRHDAGLPLAYASVFPVSRIGELRRGCQDSQFSVLSATLEASGVDPVQVAMSLIADIRLHPAKDTIPVDMSLPAT